MSAVAEHPQTGKEVAPAQQERSMVMELVSQAVRDGLPMETIRELRAMAKEEAQEIAERAFNDAMSKAQAEMQPVAADASNPQTKSRYASYAALDRVLRPIYTRHGFSISFDEGDTEKPDHIRVLAYVTHSSGFTRTYRKDMPADGKGAKGGDVMTKTHASGAADSYGMRYLLRKIFNIAVGEDDTDGNKPTNNAQISDEQLATLRDLIDQTDTDIAKFCDTFKIDALPSLPANAFDAATKSMHIKLARKLSEAKDA